jgi:enamine deaminase RidA (YjgF/YER057c/UK114 family)
MRQLISSGTTWERDFGYSRAVRIGNYIWVAGTTASDENTQPVGVGDAYAQAVYIYGKIGRALEQAGAKLSDIVRTRVYVTDLAHWEATARAHGEIFGQIRPANTLIIVKALVGAEYLVEIEADAFITPESLPEAGG